MELIIHNLKCSFCRKSLLHMPKSNKGIDIKFSNEDEVLVTFDDEISKKAAISKIKSFFVKGHEHQITVEVKSEVVEPKEYKWKLEGLHCANCAEKISNEIQKLPYVEEADFALATETLTFSLKNAENLNHVQKEMQSIVDSIEPGVKVYQKNITKEYKWKLEGLHCANCAEKISNEIQKLPYVKDADFALATETLIFSLKNAINLNYVQEEIQNIVDSIEPGVIVIPTPGTTIPKLEGENSDKQPYIAIGIGVVLAVLGKIFVTNDLWQRVLFGIALLLAGGPIYLQAFKNIKRGDIFDENFLMAIATIGAFVIGEYLEALAVMIFYQIGEYFQGKAVDSSRKSISSLLALKSEFAIVERNGEWITVIPEDVEVGERVLIKPGEKIPLDGIVLEGDSFIDTSNITGESVPRRVKQGGEVLSGCLNGEGILEIEVTKDYGDGTVANILNLVEGAASKKSKIENFITRFSRIYTPVVVITAVLLAIGGPLVTGDSFKPWIYQACIFLIISCPCALVISVPLGIFGGVGAASKKGVFVKGGNYLEALGEINTVAFDKTGTITKGVYEVTKIQRAKEISEQDFINLVAAGEYYSNHPIAKAIVNAATAVRYSEIKNYQEITGKGITFQLDDKKYFIGNESLMKDAGVTVIPVKEIGTIIYTAEDGVFLGTIIVSDTMKENAKENISAIHNLGFETVILSGDEQSVADKIAAEAGIDKAYGNLLPQDKVTKLEELMELEKSVAFVGDGVNDAPVLARADIGIAMGKLGSDAAVESADIILMNDDLKSLVDAFVISKKTRRIVLQNIIFALAVKFVVLVLGFFGVANMWEAVFADVGVTILAVFNSMRILKIKDE